MDEEAIDHFSYIATFLAHQGDGALADAELRVLVDVVQGLGGDVDSSKAARQWGRQAAETFLRDRETLDDRALATGVLQRIDRLAANGADLPRLYRELVQIVASDGVAAADESTILGIVRSRWGLG